MKQCLNPAMFLLLKDDYPVGTEYLFGDNLAYAMREVHDSRRVANQVAKKSFQLRGKPNNRRGRLMRRQSFPQNQHQSQNYQNHSQNRQFQNRSFPRGRGQSATRGRGRGSRRGSRY